MYDLELNEFGNYYLHPFNNYKTRNSKILTTVNEMITSLEDFLQLKLWEMKW
ncbi:MAG: hypothetical protein ACW99L_08130 [Promethearchaeota archaeon]